MDHAFHLGGGGLCARPQQKKNVVKMWYYVVLCGIMWTFGLQNFSKHMALDGQFYFLVLFGCMPVIPEGLHACYESVAFNGHKQTTTLSV